MAYFLSQTCFLKLQRILVDKEVLSKYEEARIFYVVEAVRIALEASQVFPLF